VVGGNAAVGTVCGRSATSIHPDRMPFLAACDNFDVDLTTGYGSTFVIPMSKPSFWCASNV
jgi:hypothetical protein